MVLRRSLAAFLVVLVNFVSFFPSHAFDTGEQKRNVLVLIADDLNSWLLDDPSRYDGTVVAPNLKRFAGQAINFQRAYTASPVCSPSRTAFFSGISPWHSGHYHNALQVSRSEPLRRALSLAGCFKQAGYSTAGFGKITHGWDQKEHWDVKVGHKRDPAPPGAPLTAVGRGEQDWGPIHLAESQMNDTGNVDQAIAHLRSQSDQPFFIACGLFNPHMPWYVPQRYFDLFPSEELSLPKLLENDLDDVPPLGAALTNGKAKFVDSVLQHGLHQDAVRAYLATTAYVDAQLGRLLTALDQSPHRDDTIVVFLSDHGFHLGEKHHWQKATLWEEATHCLLMIRTPDLPQGAVCSRFVSLQDVYPTLVELCGLAAPEPLDGRSLFPLLSDPQSEWSSTAITCLCDKGDPQQAYVTIRSDAGRYIRYGAGGEEYYDTTIDPREWKNEIATDRYQNQIDLLRRSVPAIAAMANPLPPVERKK